jgi:hypothetical protein
MRAALVLVVAGACAAAAPAGASQLAGGRRVGRLAKTATRAGTLRFSVGLDRRGRGRLARAGFLRLALRLAVTEPGAAPQRATRRVTLRAPR